MEFAYHAFKVFPGKQAGPKCVHMLAQTFKRTNARALTLAQTGGTWNTDIGAALRNGDCFAPNIVAEVHCPVFSTLRYASCDKVSPIHPSSKLSKTTTPKKSISYR